VVQHKECEADFDFDCIKNMSYVFKTVQLPLDKDDLGYIKNEHHGYRLYQADLGTDGLGATELSYIHDYIRILLGHVAFQDEKVAIWNPQKHCH